MMIIRVVDFETTGLEPPHAEVCEVGCCDVDAEAGTILGLSSWLCGVRTMPPDVRAVHHISLADCSGHPSFDASDLMRATVGFIAAHNADFETKFFAPQVPVICTYKSALRVWPNAPAHNNGTLRYWLEDQGKIKPDHELTQPAHRAGPDAYVTAHIVLALLQSGATVEQMALWTTEPRLLPTCPIGKFRGMPWSHVEAGFLGWMLRQPTMQDDLKWNAAREIERRSGRAA